MMRRSLTIPLVSTYLVLVLLHPSSSAFQPSSYRGGNAALVESRRVVLLAASAEQSAEELAFLKQELTAYLEKRKEVGADERAKQEIGKVVGGTKGNLILEYVSGSPNKETVTEDPPNPLDYDELTKYGYGNLVTRIMNAGGRLKMYELLDLTPPPVKPKKVKIAPPVVIDRFGVQTRYQGLKLGQAFNDNMQAVALQEVQEKLRNGERPASSKVLEEVEAFELPFADKRNVSPKQTPDWTVEKLDEWGRQQGRVESWARKAKQGAFVQDPMESFDSLLPQQRLYSIVTALTAATAFGKATPSFVSMVSGDTVAPNLLSVLQIPAAALLLASLGSSAYCAMTARGKNRSQYVWTLKGLLGGPLTVRQLATLSTLITQQEQDDQDRARQEDAS